MTLQYVSRTPKYPGKQISSAQIIILFGIAIFASLIIAVIFLIVKSEDRPRLAQDSRLGAEAADIVFKLRVSTAFPTGALESNMIRELKDEGFEFNLGSTEAVFDRMGLPCRNTWIVKWKASNGLLTAVDPKYGSVCL